MSGQANRGARSLLERAAEVYGFEDAFRAPAAAPELARSPEPRPVAQPESRRPASAAPAGAVAAVDREALAAAGFILPDAPVSAIAEEFRIVKRQLLHAAISADASARDRMILVASAQPDEGKTFCAVNLALSIANERDFQVLLVDADVAKPSVLSTLGLAGGKGLIDAIEDPALDVEACVIRTDLPHLSVLAAGRPSNEATELLASERARAVIDGLAAAGERRIVIFDSPPALAASPASELAHHVGQVVLVARADKTGESDLRDAAGLLAGCPRVQLLLNRVTFGAGGRRFGYYGYGD